jgi:glutathione S-transferase
MRAATGAGKVDLQAAVKAYQDLANAAPSAIQPDIQTISQAFSAFAAALAKSGYTLGQVPTASQAAALQSAVHVFSQSKLRTAAQNVAAWAKQNCTHS